MARFAFVLPGFPLKPGGGHKIVYQYANALSRRGNHVSVFHARAREERRLSCLGRVREWFIRVLFRVMRSARPRWFDLDRDVGVVNLGVLDETKIRGFDCVIATGVRTARIVAQIADRDRSSGVYLIQHYETFSAERSYVDETWLLPLTRIVVSSWLADIAGDLGVSCQVILNPIDRSEFPRGPAINIRKRSVLTLISEQSWKRSDLAIATFVRLHEWDSSVDLKAFGVGPRPADLPSYVQYDQNPSRETLSDLYRSVWVYLCTSDFEGFGLPAAEALASGAAVVSTRNGGVESFAVAGASFVAVGDIDGLVTAAMALLKDEERCQAVADAGFDETSDLTMPSAVTKFEETALAGLG